MTHKDKNRLPNSQKDDYLDHCSDALHQLTRQAEQALKAQQNNQQTEVKPKETKKE